jgi:sugar phosphate isomerase/epimerase
MVFGSPKQRSALGVPVPEAVRHFREGLAEAADHAQKRGVSILVEALDHTQTDVINTMAEAVAVVKEVNHPNIQTLFDFHNTLDEKRPLEELIRQYYSFICHVHVQEMDGKYLGAGAGATDYVPAFQALKDLGYRRWVSVEVFDFSPGPPKIAAESMRTLRAIEARLT